MRHEDIHEWDQTIYQNKCDVCGHTLNVSTQQDKYPEYYTDVYVQCECGNWVKFNLPVN